jgi:hypothetical protein
MGAAGPIHPGQPVDASNEGFAPPDRTLFAPIVELAPAGPNRAARAVAIMDRQLAFQRRISFHPVLDPRLQKVVDKLPPRQSTLIRAAALYSRKDIPWNITDRTVHEVAVAGHPDGSKFRYSLASSADVSERPQGFSGLFALRPAAGSSDQDPASVIADLQAKLYLDTYGAADFIDAISATLPEVYGDLQPPFDSSPGVFDHHDKAAVARFRRDFPALSARLEHYLDIKNVLDEFQTPDGPAVLFNLDAEVRPDSLEPFPHLYKFYRSVAPRVSTETIVFGADGKQYLRAGFDRGRITMTFMVRSGMIAPFDSNLGPAGAPIDLASIDRGRYRSVASIRAEYLGMLFGMDHLSFATSYDRHGEAVDFESRMDEVPEIIAPPVFHGMILMIAGEFMRTLAQGNSGAGLHAVFRSDRSTQGIASFVGDVSGEFRYSPTLAFLARVGDSFAEAHSEAVRKEERKLGEDLFDAFVSDYDSARPKILALDRVANGRQ